MWAGCHVIPLPLATSFALGVAAAIGDVPLAGGDDLERLVAALVELHRVRDLLRLADEVATRGEDLCHALLGGMTRGAGDRGVTLACCVRDDPFGDLRDDPPVPADDRARGQLQFTPPRHVVQIAEGADHRDARALVGIGKGVREDGHLDVEDRRADRRAEQRLVALVIRMRDERDACGQQFGPGRLDEHLRRRVGRRGEADAVVRAGALAVLELGLRDGGAIRDVPQRRGLRLVRLAAGKVAQEPELADALGVGVDRLVRLRPVDREADASPHRLEDRLVLDGQLQAQLDEVPARDRDLALRVRLGRGSEVSFVRQARVAADAVVVLHTALGRKAVVVPADRIEHLATGHALEPRDAVGVRVREDMSHVERSAGGRRGRVDREDLRP
jgi:hypothetical protein